MNNHQLEFVFEPAEVVLRMCPTDQLTLGPCTQDSDWINGRWLLIAILEEKTFSKKFF